MGSFAGHIDEGLVFIIVAVWWMVNIFSDYIKNEGHLGKYKSQVSYPVTIRGKKVPLEIYLKISFPLVASTAEIIKAGGSFVNEQGTFTSLSNLQHITIYWLFVLHGVADLFRYYRWPIIKNMEYLTASLAFIWYGAAFYFHSAPSMKKPPLENQIHRLPIPLTFMTGVAAIIEIKYRDAVLPQLMRCFSVLSLGTWFTYVSFVLFRPFPFPGNNRNPDWDQWEPTNVHFITAAFGLHLLINITFIMTSYTILRVYRNLRPKSSSSDKEDLMCKYSILNNEDDTPSSDSELHQKDDIV